MSSSTARELQGWSSKEAAGNSVFKACETYLRELIPEDRKTFSPRALDLLRAQDAVAAKDLEAARQEAISAKTAAAITNADALERGPKLAPGTRGHRYLAEDFELVKNARILVQEAVLRERQALSVSGMTGTALAVYLRKHERSGDGISADATSSDDEMTGAQPQAGKKPAEVAEAISAEKRDEQTLVSPTNLKRRRPSATTPSLSSASHEPAAARRRGSLRRASSSSSDATAAAAAAGATDDNKATAGQEADRHADTQVHDVAATGEASVVSQ